MKVFLSTDMEGTAGVVDWSQCRGPSQEYEYYRGQLQAEVNAAIDGALAAGATEFLVNDSHSTMQNLRPDELHGRASYLSGRHKPLYMRWRTGRTGPAERPTWTSARHTTVRLRPPSPCQPRSGRP
jgi:D-aminopeptidase